MIIDLTNFPDPFIAYSDKYNIAAEILEKVYRSGYLWREYDNQELLEYLQILSGKKLEKQIVKKFIRHADMNEYILDLKMRGLRTCNLDKLKDKSYIKRLVKEGL